MKKGEWIETPRFLKVQIEKVFNTIQEAYTEGYTEPTHYNSPDFDIKGKHTGINRMIFAAVRK